jgi:hypothetical protein
MSRYIALAVLALIVGSILGSGVSRYLARQHQHTHAVMWLAQFHLDNSIAAARANDCARLNVERKSLIHVYDELLLAFPADYANDAVFRGRADDLKSASQATGSVASDCADLGATVKKIHDACDACHRQYRD